MSQNSKSCLPSLVTDVIDGNDKATMYDRWAGIVIHHTDIGGNADRDESNWRKLHKNIASYLGAKDDKSVSAHFQIGRYGEITQIINPEYYIAWHAGKSEFWHPLKRRWQPGCNDFMIGIELLGDGNLSGYTEEQYLSLANLITALMDKFKTIQPHCITGHEVVSPGRKVDPGKYFDWKKLFRLLKF
jgi:AmpD protein